MKYFKLTLSALLLALLVTFYYTITSAEHRAHKELYLVHGQISLIECDQCAIEISEIVLYTLKKY
jgi:hypothetical protein